MRGKELSITRPPSVSKYLPKYLPVTLHSEWHSINITKSLQHSFPSPGRSHSSFTSLLELLLSTLYVPVITISNFLQTLAQCVTCHLGLSWLLWHFPPTWLYRHFFSSTRFHTTFNHIHIKEQEPSPRCPSNVSLSVSFNESALCWCCV